jgi:protein-disulfide isomerase
MRYTFLRILLASSVAAACSRGDAAARTATASGTAPSNATPAGASASGSVAASVLNDTISDRADRGRIMGDSTAKVWLIMASDFQCPFCKQWHDAAFAGLVQDYVNKGKIQIAFLNFPLGQHQFALPAAEAAMCAAVQHKFWLVHDGLFATQSKWEALKNPSPVFDSLVAAAGVNMPLYRQCVSKHLTLPLIEADRDRARQQGAGSTPTFIVVPGGQVIAGADANVRPALDAELAKLAGTAKKP